MTITEALNTAVHGGYHLHGADGVTTTYNGATRDFSAWTRTDNQSTFLVPVHETFLDPAFWQALGRALGWDAPCELAIMCGQEHDKCWRCQGAHWMYHWHCFIQHLAQGDPPEAFFTQLPTTHRLGERAKEGLPRPRR
jgi:hypothetical protein